jgi:hypothetical protein
MRPGSKVVSSHDISSVKNAVSSNPNLDPNLINKRFEEAEEAQKKSSSIPRELKGLEDLIFLGASTRDVQIGDFTFTLGTLSAREQDEIFREAIKLPETERVFFFKKAILACSIKKINGKNMSSYIDDVDINSRINVVMSLQQSVFDYLFSEVDKLTEETSKSLTEDNLKK